jgi:hypothetical protein
LSKSAYTLLSVSISPRTSPISEKKNRSKNQSNAEQIRGSHSSLSYFQFFLPKKNSDELKRDRQTSRNKYEVVALGSSFFQNRVFTLLSVSISPRTSPLSGKKNPAQTKALPENRYTDPTTPLCSISILLAQGKKTNN